VSGITVYCPASRWRGRIEAALGAADDILMCADWQSFEREASSSTCLVVVIEWLQGQDVIGRLTRLRLMVPHRPLVLVTARDVEAVRAVSGVSVQAIVWPHEVERMLAPAVSRLAATPPGNRLERALETAVGLPHRLRTALLIAFRAAEPVVKLDQLAARAGCDRRTLWRDLKRLGPLPWRLQDLVDWILIVRLAVEKARGRSWSAVAAAAGMNEDSLARIVRRLTGQNLAELAVAGEAGITREFEARVLTPLLERSSASAT
jgi:hypothetical protein